MKPMFGTIASTKILKRLEEHGYETVFVGGAVRDYVLGRPAKDIDIATAAEPTEVKALFPNTIDIGIEHGTVLVLMDKEPIEVTTFRTDGTYTDHRRPDDVLFVKSLREDLLRRDFTINALAMRIDGELVDLFGGQSDLANKIIRAVGNPHDRFQEDALRMLRAIRFSSVLDFNIEEQTFQAIKMLSTEIRHVSIERLKIEMDKLFVGANVEKAFHYLETSNLGASMPLFPERTGNLDRLVPFTSSDEGWAYLMIAGNDKPTNIARAYKLSNIEQKFLTAVDELFESRKMRPFEKNDLYRFDIAVLTTVERFFACFYTEAPTSTVVEIEIQKNALPIQSIKDIKIDGSDLIQWTGRKGGPWTGEWLKKIEQEVLYERCENNPTTIKDWFMHEFDSEK